MSLQQARDPSSPNNVMITGLAPVLGKGLEGGIGVGRVNVGAVIECGLYLGRKRAGVLIRVYAECKYLLMRRAFESLNAGRVAVKTDAKNGRSRKAIENLGATYEGTLRNHRLLSTGIYRDSAYYSVINSEWPTVREQLSRVTAPA
jgi:hypothetical protein